MVLTVLGRWPLRRWIAVLILTVLLGVTFVRLAGVPVDGLGTGWFTLASLAALLSAGVLGSYVPGRGLRPDVGCAPCAVMPVATVVGAGLAVGTYGAALTGPALAAAVTLFGMTQRMGNVTSCEVAAGQRGGD